MRRVEQPRAGRLDEARLAVYRARCSVLETLAALEVPEQAREHAAAGFGQVERGLELAARARAGAEARSAAGEPRGSGTGAALFLPPLGTLSRDQIRVSAGGRLVCPLCDAEVRGERMLRAHLRQSHVRCPREGCGRTLLATDLAGHLAAHRAA